MRFPAWVQFSLLNQDLERVKKLIIPFRYRYSKTTLKHTGLDCIGGVRKVVLKLLLYKMNIHVGFFFVVCCLVSQIMRPAKKIKQGLVLPPICSFCTVPGCTC